MYVDLNPWPKVIPGVPQAERDAVLAHFWKGHQQDMLFELLFVVSSECTMKRLIGSDALRRLSDRGH
jgi:hypothetical protein